MDRQVLSKLPPSFCHRHAGIINNHTIAKGNFAPIRVQARVQGQWYVRYVDAEEALPENPEPSMIRTTLWDQRKSYCDPDPHPTELGVNAGRNRRKLEGIQEGRIVVCKWTHRMNLGCVPQEYMRGNFVLLRPSFAPTGHMH